MDALIRFILNGQPEETGEPGDTTLLQYLRGTRCLRGAKEGCGTGHCGACSVLIDGQLRRACVTKLKAVEGRSVETIENLARDGLLSDIQRSFLDAGAVQCGFCTPGMVMATKALLLKNANPSEEEIREGLKHNYCRCTGYVKILQAVRLAAARMRGEDPDPESFRTGEATTVVIGRGQDVPPLKGTAVGRSVWDVDGPAKVTGTLKFCDDLDPADLGEESLLWGAFVWAPVPRARILSLDVTQAEKAPGVVRVLTWKDVPGVNKFGNWTPEQPVFCRDEVRFLGDHPALVVADSDRHAREAARLVKVEYQALDDGIYSMEQGYRRESFIVHTGRQAGDVESARRREDLVRVRVSKDIEPQEHACMEPESAIGLYRDGRVTLYACTQAPFEVRRNLAAVLALPEDRIRVVATPLGGGFGSKCDSTVEAPAAVAGYVCRRPVKITLTRYESLIASTKRHGYHTDYEVGFTRDGKFEFLDCRMFSDGGPYECESYGTLMTGCLMSGGPYEVKNLRVEGSAVRTNNLLGGAFRGYGINQAAISIETALDMAAEKLGLDPFELRRRNAVRAGSYSVGGERLEHSVGLLDTIDRCEERLRLALREYQGKYPQGSRVLGWGMASGFKNVGVGKGIFVDDGGCKLILEKDGRLHMIVSGTDMGQGFRTAMVQLAAEAMEMDMGRIYIEIGDTDITFPTGESVSERQTLCGGRAVVEACALLRRELEKRPWRPGEERRAEYYFTAPECFAIGDFQGAREKGLPYRNFPAYAYTTQAAIVEVDRDTGETRVLKVIAAHDVGRAVNPRIIEGQIQGSCSMGQGYALTESFPCREGYPVKTLYRQLGLPRAEDTPAYELVLIEDPEPLGPYGAKGISEVATVPITPAILNAIYNAIGVRINRVPATPEVIRQALRTGRCQVPTMEEKLAAIGS